MINLLKDNYILLKKTNILVNHYLNQKHTQKKQNKIPPQLIFSLFDTTSSCYF